MVDLSKNPTARADKNYHDFPMHQHVEFTSTVAQLLPVYYDLLDPGDVVHVSQYMKTRTQPLSTAAMAKIQEHIEWFFVPMHQIYKPFSNFFYGVQDFDSSLYDSHNANPELRMSEKFPYVKLKDFINDAIANGFVGSNDRTTLKGEYFYGEMVRLMEHLGMPAEVFLDDLETLSGDNSYSFTPLLACAYQKIFMDHYRNGDRTSNDPSCYNLDKFFSPDYEGDIVTYLNDYASGPNELACYMIGKFFEMRYRPVARDFYTNNFPSPVMAASAASAQRFGSRTDYVDTTLDQVKQWLTQKTDVSIATSSGMPDYGQEGASHVNMSGDYSGNMLIRDFNEPNIRTMFAVDKLLEVTRRAGKHYDAQTLAHFGVKVPMMIEGSCVKIGSHTQDLVIGDVVATAETEGTPLGEIAGKGYSAAGSDRIKFTAPCHGVLMAIYSSEPVLDYYQQGADKLNSLIDKSDFFIPDYDNLGMQPLFGYQTILSRNNSVRNSRVLGWQYRYMELKQKMNRIIGGLKFTQKHWTVGRESRFAADSSSERYYHDPTALNSIMEYKYLNGFKEDNVTPVDSASLLFARDPLIHEIFFDVKKATKKSPYGLMPL